MHYALHHTKLPQYMREMKKYHLAHHYKNFELGFGVTSESNSACDIFHRRSFFHHFRILPAFGDASGFGAPRELPSRTRPAKQRHFIQIRPLRHFLSSFYKTLLTRHYFFSCHPNHVLTTCIQLTGKIWDYVFNTVLPV
jgi:hypothetical protein